MKKRLNCATVLLDDASSAGGLMREARAQAGPGVEIGLVGWREQNLLQAIGPTAEFGFRRPWDEQLRSGAAWTGQAPRSRVLLVNEAAMLPCVDRAASHRLGNANRRAWWLVPAGAVTACIAEVPAAASAIPMDGENDDE